MTEVTSSEAGKIIGVTEVTIRSYVDRELLKARRQGLKRKVYINLVDLEAFAKEFDFHFDTEQARQITRQ